jgi:hypothetical protein
MNAVRASGRDEVPETIQKFRVPARAIGSSIDLRLAVADHLELVAEEAEPRHGVGWGAEGRGGSQGPRDPVGS